MFKFFYNPDWGTRSLLAIFTLGSAALSAYAGWSLANQAPWLFQIASAAILGCVALGLGICVMRASRYLAGGDYARHLFMLIGVAFFMPLNLITDYGASSVIRDQANVASKNTNTRAKDLRDGLARKRKELTALKEERAWTDTGLLSPQAYDAKVFALKNETENGRNIWKRSEQCQNTTVASSQRVCQAIATALANKAVAERRQVLLPEIQTREAEITAMEKEFKASDQGFTSNPAMAQIKKIVSWATFSLNHENSTITWGENAVMLIITITMTAAITIFGWEVGQRSGALSEAPQYESFNPYLGMSAQARASAERYAAEQAARAGGGMHPTMGSEAAPGVSKETIILKSSDAPPKTDDSLMQSLKAMEIAAQRALARSQTV